MHTYARAFGAGFVLLLTLAAPADAATFTVTNTNDSGAGSLRAAIDNANADVSAISGSPHSIVFSGVTGHIVLASALPIITNHMTIDGGTLGTIALDGNGLYRGFFVDLGTVVVKNLAIYNTRAKGGSGGGGGGGGAGLGGAFFVNQTSARLTVDTVAISTSNVTGGSGVGPTSGAGGGGGGMAFDGAIVIPPTGPFNWGGGGGGGLFGPGSSGSVSAGTGGTGGAGGGGGGGGLPTGGLAGSTVTNNPAPTRGFNQSDVIAINGEAPIVGGYGGFGGGGGGGSYYLATGFVGAGGTGGFGGGGGGVTGVGVTTTSPPARGGYGGFGGGGGSGVIPGVGGTGGGTGGTREYGGGGAAFGSAAFVNFGTLTIINSTAFNLSATPGPVPDSGSNGATAGTADATPIYNRHGTVVGSFTDGTPQTGYWWVATESGRGFPIEFISNRVFMTFYHYANDGTTRWWVSTGTMTNAARYSGAVSEHANGQQLNGAYQAPGAAVQTSTVSLIFYGPTTAQMTWADGTLPLTRFDLVTGGVAAGPSAGSPQKGWYWSSSEGGRGWYLEVQGSTLFLSGYMYDSRGQATWYVSQGPMTTTALYGGTLFESGNGKTIGGTNQAPTFMTNRGTVTLTFPTASTALLTLPGGGSVVLTRFTF